MGIITATIAAGEGWLDLWDNFFAVPITKGHILAVTECDFCLRLGNNGISGAKKDNFSNNLMKI